MEVISVCLKYNTSFINILSFTLSIIIVAIFCLGTDVITKNIFVIRKEKTKIAVSNIQINNEIKTEKSNQNIENNVNENYIKKESNEFDWYIEIPKIKLYAPIEEGTDDEILNRSVGHFENTSRRNGNCGLAAHNRGYRVNYFANVKELEKGDLIYYFVDGKKYKYEISEIVIIYETDWSMLEDTEEDKITLITCVENREEYRLCVQGELMEEE